MLCQSSQSPEISTGIFSLVLFYACVIDRIGSSRAGTPSNTWGRPPEMLRALRLELAFDCLKNPLIADFEPYD